MGEYQLKFSSGRRLVRTRFCSLWFIFVSFLVEPDSTYVFKMETILLQVFLLCFCYIFFYCAVQKIPTAYTRNMKGNLPAKVLLKDLYDNFWMVDVEVIESELYLVGGWFEFVQESS